MDARSDSPMDRGDVSPGSQETGYIPVRVLGRGAFGEAVLYRKVEAGVARHYVAIEILRAHDAQGVSPRFGDSAQYLTNASAYSV